MTTKQHIDTNAIIPPGEYLEETLEAREMTQKALADAMGRPAQMVSELIRGKKELTADTALDLERVLGIPAYIWMSFESTYRLALAKAKRVVSSPTLVITPASPLFIRDGARSGGYTTTPKPQTWQVVAAKSSRRKGK
jgi:addiction module HigA family antidote